MSDNDNKGFTETITGVILGGVGIGCVNIPEFPIIIGVLMVISGITLIINGLNQ